MADQKKYCEATKHNRRVPDFSCNMGLGHSDAHRDPRTGQRWRDSMAGPGRVLPYGLRSPVHAPQGSGSTLGSWHEVHCVACGVTTRVTIGKRLRHCPRCRAPFTARMAA